jgi:DNA-cytosine methyltransferase
LPNEFKACNLNIATERKPICRFDEGYFYKSNLPLKQTLNILQKRIHEKYPNSKARTKPFSFANDDESRRIIQAQALYRAYIWHQDVHDQPDNYAEDANSFCKVGGYPGMSKKITVGTDCSGLEAPIIALNNMNVDHKHLFSCDNNIHVKEHIRVNFKPIEYYDNIEDRDTSSMPHVDIYVAGFPCQPFSDAGKKQAFEDDKGRGKIFYKILEYIKLKLPKVFILENVKGILKRDNGAVVRRIMRLLNAVKQNGKKAYNIKYELMDTKDHGLPQSRCRWYCVGIRTDTTEEEYVGFPGFIPCPSIETLLDENSSDVISNHKLISEKTKSMAANLEKSKYEIEQKGKKIEQEPHIVDCDASYLRSFSLRGVSPCLTSSRHLGLGVGQSYQKGVPLCALSFGHVSVGWGRYVTKMSFYKK